MPRGTSSSSSSSKKRSAPSSSTSRKGSSSTMWPSQKKKKGSSSSSSNSHNHATGFNETAAKNLFEELAAKEEDPEVLTMEGIVALGEKMGLDAMEDMRILVLLWKMGCTSSVPGSITKSEWMAGCRLLHLDSWSAFEQLTEAQLDVGFLTNAEFKEFYKFCFQFNRQGTHKTLEKDLVIGLLKLILLKTERVSADRVNSFCTFLESQEGQQYSRITADQWTSFWDFCQEFPTASDLSAYDESTSAWPVLLDEYVEYVVEQQKTK